MFKISRLTDYGVVVLCYLAEKSEIAAQPCSARDLSMVSGLPLPTVSKLLKMMAKHKLIAAKRGATGGYELSEHPTKISLLRMIEIFEGPPAMTACMTESHQKCQINDSCPQRNHWYVVHKRVAQVLSEISLAELLTSKRPLALNPIGAFKNV